MRYYDIQIFTPSVPDRTPPKLFKQFSSLKNGVFNPGNLMVEFDRYTTFLPSQTQALKLSRR